MRLGHCVEHLPGVLDRATFEVHVDQLVSEAEVTEARHLHMAVDPAGLLEGPLGGASPEDGGVGVRGGSRRRVLGSDKS